MRTPVYRPTDQTRFGAPFGNCLEAAIATLVGVSTLDVPDPRKRLGGTDSALRRRIPAMRRWLVTEFGLTLETGWGAFPPIIATLPRDVRQDQGWIASGMTARGLPHAVVYAGVPGSLIHDPHPSRMGVREVTRWYILVPAQRTTTQEFSP